MIVRLDQLTDGSHRRTWEGKIDQIDLVYPDESADVGVKADIHRLRDLITVRGDISALFVRPCDRCLEPARTEISTPLHVVIRVRSISTETEEGDDGEFIVTVSDDDIEVDLTEVIRDRLVVEVPMVVHCSETCNGLCPDCGTDLNRETCNCASSADQRLAALGSIQIKE